MDRADQILLGALIVGSLLAGSVGAVAGAGLRPQIRTDGPREPVIVSSGEVFADGAPAYPSFAPAPLYPEARARDFAEAWDEAMEDHDAMPQPVAMRPPADLPPPYEVRMESDAKPQDRPAPPPQSASFY